MGSSESISAATVKLINTNTTIEISRGPMREAQDTRPSMRSMEASVPSARTWNFRHSVAFPKRDEHLPVQPVQRCGAKILARSSDLTFAEG